MKVSDAILTILRSVLALAAGSVVFVLVFLNRPTVALWQNVGHCSFQAVNHAVMLTLGLAVGTVVILICSRRDFVTPALAALALFVLGRENRSGQGSTSCKSTSLLPRSTLY